MFALVLPNTQSRSLFVRSLQIFAPRSLRLFLALAIAPASIARCAAPQVAVLTYHNDNLRTGANIVETALTPSNVNAATFGKLYAFPVDSFVYAQPLYVPNLTINGSIHNVVIVVTENNTIYAFDADNKVSSPLWKAHAGPPVPCSTNQPVPGSNCNLVYVSPGVGITGTPVIDLSQPPNGALYVEVRVNPNNAGKYFHALVKLDISTGKQLTGSPVVIEGSVKGNGRDNINGKISFNLASQQNRGALLLSNGIVYVPFGSINDAPIFHGWVFGYDASTLQRRYQFMTTPNISSNNNGDGEEGAIWNGALAADAFNNIFTATGNGTWDNSSTVHDWGNSYLKLRPGTGLVVSDYFTPKALAFDHDDSDLGTNSVVLLPDQAGPFPHILISGDKNGTLYVVNRDNMGQYNSSADQILAELPNAVGVRVVGNPDCSSDIRNDCNYGSGAYWNGNLYFSGVNDSVKAFAISNGALRGPTSRASQIFGFPGASPSVSANGTTNGILWVVEPAKSILHAYDATNVANELYNSTQASGGRDALGSNVKFAPPTIANGKVFIGTQTQLVVYGLLP